MSAPTHTCTVLTTVLLHTGCGGEVIHDGPSYAECHCERCGEKIHVPLPYSNKHYAEIPQGYDYNLASQVKPFCTECDRQERSRPCPTCGGMGKA